ncbi:MAG: phosphoethanolamine--lipid A transferase [Gammaproteobacteria bacterium]|nr:phosphoethanolamine--lipid A transferase [Gammaproteobacteria bacterium]MBU2477590.1 phosphoethanolamine--lipid A transferase [Gammaproteobacteria bacterium]
MKITQQTLILITAIFLAASANLTFFGRVLESYPLSIDNLGFLLTLPVIMCGVLILLLSLLCYRGTCRPILSLFIIIGALSAYFTDRFGTIIDTTMIQNMLETNSAEAADLITPHLLVRLVLFGLLPIFILWRVKLSYAGMRKELHSRLTLIGSTLVIMLVCIFSFGSHYSSFAREHKPLRYFINPTYPLYSAMKYFRQSGESEQRPMTTIGADARIPESDIQRELIILVVGETARADHFSLNGYPRKTNPLLEQEPRLYSYTQIASCGTSTAVSVPCMFSNLGHETFEIDAARYQDNALDILQRSGVSILWRDNNSSSKDVALRVPYEDFKSPSTNSVCDVECRDVGMLAGLQEYINKQPGDILIVLHQMGNHGPAYYKRYPAEFERFTPACQTSELAECSEEEITNAYDNAILYTDYFLSQAIDLLKRNTPAYETTLIYLSDHGESLGEHGVFLHGMPYAMAPDAQTHVPLLLWFGESADVDLTTIESRSRTPNTQDAVFHTLLNVFEIDSDALDKSKLLYDTDE